MGDLHGVRDHFLFRLFKSDETVGSEPDTGMSADKPVLRIFPVIQKGDGVEAAWQTTMAAY